MENIELFNDHFQNFKVYGIPKAQLIIADPPYNLGKNAYASNPVWYKDGDNKNGESELAGTEFFDTDNDFRPAEFMHFCSQMLCKDPKQGISEEDLALTWKDIRRIIFIADELTECMEAGIIKEPYIASEQTYYEEVLRRFTETKQNELHQK